MIADPMDAVAVSDPPADQAAAFSPGTREVAAGNPACRLSGSVFAFSDEPLDALYPHRHAYFFDVWKSVIQLRRQGLLLAPDALTILIDALQAQVGGNGGG